MSRTSIKLYVSLSCSSVLDGSVRFSQNNSREKLRSFGDLASRRVGCEIYKGKPTHEEETGSEVLTPITKGGWRAIRSH